MEIGFTGFKPYYKWNTFNTLHKFITKCHYVCSFKPYYKWNTFNTRSDGKSLLDYFYQSFKPYYKWNTFNTFDEVGDLAVCFKVLNLIINGIPSILKLAHLLFRVYYTF